jgi:hypothetical protein
MFASVVTLQIYYRLLYKFKYMTTSPGDTHSTGLTTGSADTKKAKSAKAPKPRDIVAQKYQECGWTTITATGINDLISQKDKQTHFIQVVLDETALKHQTQARNDFIQNAKSNGAIPVYAKVAGTQVSLQNIDENKRILLRAPKSSDDSTKS